MQEPLPLLFAKTVGTFSRRSKQVILWSIDVLLPPLAFLLACVFTYNAPWPAAELLRLSLLFPTLALAGGILSLLLALPWIKLKTFESFGPGPLIPYAGLLGGIVLGVTAIPGLHFPVVGTLSFALILFLVAFAVRMTMLRVFVWTLRHSKKQVRVLIYGAGNTGLQLASALKSHDSVSVVAFIDDDPNLHRTRLSGLRIHPSSMIEGLVRNHEVTRAILAIPSLSMPKQVQIGRSLDALGLEVQVLPSFAQLVGTEALVDNLTALAPADFLGRARLDAALPDGSAAYAGRCVMVTGAGGSIGSELCRQLLICRPAKLVLFEVSEHALYTIDRELRELDQDRLTTIVPCLGSITDARSTRQALSDHGVEIVLHAAAYKHVPLVEANPLPGLANNVLGTRVLVDSCVKEGVGRFLLVSTDKAVRPTNVMGASKRFAEMVVQDIAARTKGMHFAIVRFGNVLGSSGSVVPLFKEQIARGGPITLTHDDVTRYFMTISEAARLVLLAGALNDDDQSGHADVFVLDMGKPIRIRQLAEQLIHAAGYTVRDQHNPSGDIEIRVVGLRPGEKLHEELLIGAGMEKTPHPKIKRAAEDPPGDTSVPSALQELSRLTALGDAAGARALAMSLANDAARPPRPRLVAVAKGS